MGEQQQNAPFSEFLGELQDELSFVNQDTAEMQQQIAGLGQQAVQQAVQQPQAQQTQQEA